MNVLQSLFGDLFPAERFEHFQNRRGKQRRRLFIVEVTFWSFLYQVISQNADLSAAVSQVQASLMGLGKKPPSSLTGAYSQARAALPIELLEQLHGDTCGRLRRASTQDDLWRDRVIKMVVGTSVQAVDTPDNQAVWPQPLEKNDGCGFPVVYQSGLLNWSTSAWEQWLESDSRHHEAKKMLSLLPYVKAGDVLVADRAYSSYTLLAKHGALGADLITRVHQRRHIHWENGKRLSGANDKLFTWVRTRRRPSGSPLTDEEWGQLPEPMEVRIIRERYRDRYGSRRSMSIVTTLFNAQHYPADEIAMLYRQRWDIELRIRDIKLTLKMEVLRSKSPEMVCSQGTDGFCHCVQSASLLANPGRQRNLSLPNTNRF